MADFNEQFNKFNDTPDTTSEFEAEDIEKNKVMAILAYIGILVLIPIFAAKDSKFAKFHANQGLLLFIIETALGIVNAILGKIPVLGVIFTIAKLLVYLACAAVSVKCLLDVYNGKAKLLPYANRLGIGKFIK